MGDTKRIHPDEAKNNPIVHSNQDHPHLSNGKMYNPLLLNEWSRRCHQASVDGGWWNDLTTGQWKDRNVGEMMMLMVSELAEGFEGIRKAKMDDHLPHRTSIEVELADLLIRVFDFAGYHQLDLDGAVREKMAYNKTRADHKPENRMKDGGKQF